MLYVTYILHFLSSSVSHQKNLSVTLPTLKIPYGDATPGDPTPSADPTPNHIHIPPDPSTIQFQPNPSYCLLEMSHQQPMSSQLENEAEYAKYL